MDKRAGVLILFFALLISLAAYIGTLNFQFVYDDTDQIVKNQAIQSWAAAPQYFTRDVWPHSSTDDVGNYYRPVFLLWLLVIYKFFGLNPLWWHLMSVMAHLCVVFLVYRLTLKLTQDEIVAGSTALIFGLHPVHIESVAWVSGITDPLLAIFFITSFLCFLKNREQSSSADRPPARFWIASLVLYAVALLEKEAAVMLPAIIFSYTMIFPTRGTSTAAASSDETLSQRVIAAFLTTIPYLLLTALYLLVRFIALRGFGHTQTTIPISTLLATWTSVLFFYLRLLVWPFGLSAFYDTPYITSLHWGNFFLPLLIIVGVAAGLYWWSRRSRVVAFAAFWMILLILPPLNLSVFKEGEIAHDRYLYLPSVGFCLIVAVALRRLMPGAAKFHGVPVVQAAVLIIVACILGFATARQSLPWATNLALYQRGIQIAPDNYIAINNLAKELASREKYNEAIGLFLRALKRKPDYQLANYNVGYIYYKLGDHAKAEQYLNRAIEIDPREPDQYRILGFSLLETGQMEAAEAALRHAIRLRPDAAEQHLALGIILKKKGDLDGALREFNTELNYNPNQTEARQHIAEIEKMKEQK